MTVYSRWLCTSAVLKWSKLALNLTVIVFFTFKLPTAEINNSPRRIKLFFVVQRILSCFFVAPIKSAEFVYGSLYRDFVLFFSLFYASTGGKCDRYRKEFRNKIIKINNKYKGTRPYELSDRCHF